TWTVINWCVYDDYGYDVWEEDDYAECDLFVDWDGDGDRDCRTFRDGWNTSGTPGTPDGYIDYKQIIKVVDVDEPTFEIPEIDGCIVETDCDKDLVIPYPNIMDVCSPSFEVDITGDFGVFNDIQGDITIDDVVPGTYDIYYTVTDNCGNQAYDNVTVVVEDCKKPTPYCKNGIVVEIMQTGMVDVWASDLNDNSFDNCPGDLIFSFSSDVTDIGNTYTCADLGVIQVEMWVTDAAGNQDFCVTSIILQDNMFSCDPTTQPITVAGLIETEEVEPVEDVMVEVNGGLFVDNTDGAGAFGFNLVENGDYSITPMHDVNPLNGVTTYDLVLITQHILNINPLGSPYKMIAADANNSHTVTTLDLVAIQKLILNVEPTFPNNTSWRFVDAAYEFPQSNNPWAEVFPEVINYNNLTADQLNADFIAVKVGDVNSSAQTSAAMIPQDRTVGNLAFHTQQVELNAGDRYTMAFTAADQAILGYQFTLNFNAAEVKIVGIGEGLANEDNFGFTMLNEGALTTSWHVAEGRTFAADEVVFSIEIEALTDINLADAFTVNSRFTTEEAYNVAGEHLNVELVFGTETGASFALYQNVPNPFKASTVIGFNLPEDSKVTVQIMDVSGKVLRTVEGDYFYGYNEIIVKDLEATGVLYYQLSTPTHTATKKMIVTK
ncbi:MAG: T9SS type A sorting domain-containing protein, partial [Phaeodactylibacter sp.]|nr:T9SS type A sorting domain-containing protein [Phaeodactylibacter sp.]